jgi:hypothetical protein
MVTNPHSPSILRVQRIIDGEVKEYTVQEDVEQAIQRDCEVRFSLVHCAPIMNSLLGEWLHYLFDESLAKANKQINKLLNKLSLLFYVQCDRRKSF